MRDGRMGRLLAFWCFLASWPLDIQGQIAVPACPNNNCPGLGNVFYLSNYNSLNDTFTGGTVIFENRTLGECVTFQQFGKASRQFTYTNDSGSFLDNVAADADITASYNSDALTFKGTFQLTTSYDVASQFDVQSLVLDITYLTGVLNFQQNDTCWAKSNVSPTFLAAFTQLPATIGDPTQSPGWAPYITFLQSWGSHIMVQASLGSRFQQWESVLTSQNVSQDTLQAKACADVEGASTTGGGWSVSGCAAYSSSEKQTADSTATTVSQVVIGGTAATRSPLVATTAVTQQALDAFIASADQADEVAVHGWLPIWDLLSALYQPDCSSTAGTCDNYQRALNLEAAYEGWQAFGCPLITTDVPGLPIQIMIANTDQTTGIQTYGCWVAKEGCVDGGSCHGGGFPWTACYCYGPGCVVKDPNKPVGDPNAPTDYREDIQTAQTGSYDEGVNNSCYQYGLTCNCNTSDVVGAPARFIWDQLTSQTTTFVRRSPLRLP